MDEMQWIQWVVGAMCTDQTRTEALRALYHTRIGERAAVVASDGYRLHVAFDVGTADNTVRSPVGTDERLRWVTDDVGALVAQFRGEQLWTASLRIPFVEAVCRAVIAQHKALKPYGYDKYKKKWEREGAVGLRLTPLDGTLAAESSIRWGREDSWVRAAYQIGEVTGSGPWLDLDARYLLDVVTLPGKAGHQTVTLTAYGQMRNGEGETHAQLGALDLDGDIGMAIVMGRSSL